MAVIETKYQTDFYSTEKYPPKPTKFYEDRTQDTERTRVTVGKLDNKVQ